MTSEPPSRQPGGGVIDPDELGDHQGLGLVGPPADYVEIPNWVALSVISPQAMAVYMHIVMHLRDGIQPTRSVLAERVRATPTELAGYLAELFEIGAITKGGEH